jgi:hypothetical protein
MGEGGMLTAGTAERMKLSTFWDGCQEAAVTGESTK